MQSLVGQNFQCYFILLSLQNDSILSYDLSYLLRGGVPYHGQFQKSYQRRIEYGGTGKTTTKQNTINNSWMSLGWLVFGSGLFVCSASLENSQIPRWFVIYENKNRIILIYENLVFLDMPLQ